MTAPLPRTITNIEGHLGTVTDNVLLSGLNVVGCDQANITGMYATILEPFLNSGGRAILIGDNNHVAGLSIANPNHPQGQGYDVVTLGHGNKGAEIHKDDGSLVAELALRSDKTVVLNLGRLDRMGVRTFLHDFANAMSLAEDVQTIPTLLGYTEQSRHFLRQHTGSTKTTRETQFMNGRLREQNIRQMNAVGAIQDVPIEFNQSIANVVAMVQTSPKGRFDLAKHLGAPHRVRIIAEQNTPDCGVAYAGVNHGTYFNPSDLDPRSPYILMVKQTHSLFGTAPDPERKINDATRDFVKQLKDARRARDENREKAENEKIVQAAMKNERNRLLKIKGRENARAKNNAVISSDTAKRRRGPQLPCGGLRERMFEAGVSNASTVRTVITALTKYENLAGMRVPTQSLDAMVEFAKTDEVQALVRRSMALAGRSEIYLFGAWAVAETVISKIDPAKANAFFDQLLKDADRKSCGQILQRRLEGLTDCERTTHRVLDYIFQAWSAFSSGRTIERFVDNDEISVRHAEIVQIDRMRVTAKAA